MNIHQRFKAHSELILVALATTIAATLAMGPIASRSDKGPSSSRSRIYSSLPELVGDAELRVDVRQASTPRIERIRDFDYSVADFTITSKIRRGETITAILPIDTGPRWQASRAKSMLLFLEQFRFGDGQRFDLYVILGDTSGIFALNEGKLTFERIYHGPDSLPDQISAAEVGVQL